MNRSRPSAGDSYLLVTTYPTSAKNLLRSSSLSPNASVTPHGFLYPSEASFSCFRKKAASIAISEHRRAGSGCAKRVSALLQIEIASSRSVRSPFLRPSSTRCKASSEGSIAFFAIPARSSFRTAPRCPWSSRTSALSNGSCASAAAFRAHLESPLRGICLTQVAPICSVFGDG